VCGNNVIAVVLFSAEAREKVRGELLARAEGDSRIVAAAVVGSEAEGNTDRFSDLDLTFGVRTGVPVAAVLADWTESVRTDMDGEDLFDLAVGSTVYRVFLLPGNLQVDLSFSPETEFGATGPRFRLLFGDAVERPWTVQPEPRELFGRAVHHALRARVAIERGRLWQAEYWLSETRHHALALASLGHDLSAWHARSADRLPAELRKRFEETLVGRVDREDLFRALTAVVGLLREAADGAAALNERVDERLESLVSA
jgi:hypothetical protein